MASDRAPVEALHISGDQNVFLLQFQKKHLQIAIKHIFIKKSSAIGGGSYWVGSGRVGSGRAGRGPPAFLAFVGRSYMLGPPTFSRIKT